MPGVLNLAVMSVNTALTLFCYLVCVVVDPGRSVPRRLRMFGRRGPRGGWFEDVPRGMRMGTQAPPYPFPAGDAPVATEVDLVFFWAL